MGKESGKKFVENFNKAKLSVKYLKKLLKWSETNRVVPLEIMSEKEAKEVNKEERLLSAFYGLTINKWKKGDRYYQIIFPFPEYKTRKLRLVKRGRNEI